MKPRVTITISRPSLRYVDRLVGKRGASRSQVVESFIVEEQQRRREQELARLAKEFFAQPESAEETQEKRGWLDAGLETWKLDR